MQNDDLFGARKRLTAGSGDNGVDFYSLETLNEKVEGFV